MKSSPLLGQLDETGEHNDVVPLILGFLKLSDDIASAACDESETMHPHDESGSDLNNQMVMATLGILSIRKVLLEWLEQSCPEEFDPLANQPSVLNEQCFDLLQ